MIALELTNIKDFMNKLLKTETFDHFLLQEAVLSSAASYVIDGHITNGFFSEGELEELGLTGLKMLPFSSLQSPLPRQMSCRIDAPIFLSLPAMWSLPHASVLSPSSVLLQNSQTAEATVP